MDSLALALPDNIKEVICKNVAELKELLKDDNEFAEKLIWHICNLCQYILPESVISLVWEHYKCILGQC